jgi:hypothetical protein
MACTTNYEYSNICHNGNIGRRKRFRSVHAQCFALVKFGNLLATLILLQQQTG